ncbi:MAG: hypothetical protein ABR507_01950 [Actinomycetota bacterium]
MGFKEWVGSLTHSDDHDLRELELPNSQHIKAVARSPMVYGFVVDSASKAAMLSILDDSAIKGAAISDASFRLEP